MSYKVTITPANAEQMQQLLYVAGKYRGWFLRLAYEQGSGQATSAKIQFEEEKDFLAFEAEWADYLAGINGES